MSGRYGGSQFQKKGNGGRRKKEWQAPRIQAPRTPRLPMQTRGAALLAGAGFYLLTVAGSLLTVLA